MSSWPEPHGSARNPQNGTQMPSTPTSHGSQNSSAHLQTPPGSYPYGWATAPPLDAPSVPVNLYYQPGFQHWYSPWTPTSSQYIYHQPPPTNFGPPSLQFPPRDSAHHTPRPRTENPTVHHPNAALGSPVALRNSMLSGTPSADCTGGQSALVCPNCRGPVHSPVTPQDASPFLVNSDDVDGDSPSARRKRADVLKKIVSSIQHDLKSTPMKMLLEVLKCTDPSSDLYLTQCAFYRAANAPTFFSLLDTIYEDSDGKRLLRRWMKERGIKIICDMVNKEMDAAKPSLHMLTSEVSPSYIDTWDPCSIMEPVEEITPIWSAVLTAATTPSSGDNPTAASAQSRQRTRCIISAQVHHLRSQMSAKFQIGMGLVASAVGASRSLIDMLHSAGLSIAYTTISKALGALADSNMEKARETSAGPHAKGYDNVNLSGSIHVEQRPGAPSKVQSGTLPIIYKIPNVSLEDMRIEPILENLRNASPLIASDIRMTDVAAESFRHQSRITIINILLQYSVVGFSSDSPIITTIQNFKSHPSLQYRARRQLPVGPKTEFYPLRVTPIEEASVPGNLNVHTDIYIHQLQMTPEHLSKYAIPAINDQLTNARIRGGQVWRRKDCNVWERREVFQLAFGTFHLLMNLIWGILQNHRGSAKHLGSLAYYFALLDKVRLGTDRPDFHTLLAALTQILHGLILNAWREEVLDSDMSSLAAYLDVTDSDCLHAVADHIITKYVTIPPSDVVFPPSDEPAGAKKKKTKKGGPDSAAPRTDTVHENTRLLTRDILYALEIATAMKTGDFGRIEDILPDLACLFRGVGSNNYCVEVLHFIFNIKEVWTPKFADIMRDMMLVNITGLAEHFMAVDLNEEHTVREVKVLFVAKGLHAGWDRGANISCCVHQLNKLKKQAVKAMGTSYSGSTHTTPDTTACVLLIASKAREEGLQTRKSVTERPKDELPDPVVDALLCGYQKVTSATLDTFNKKVLAAKDRRYVEVDTTAEADEISPPAFSEIVVDDSDN